MQSASYRVVEDLNTRTILSPSLQERKTAKIQLENGLSAYLISDPKATQSGASLTVEVGSFNDPDTFPGMAHFCEHMLFMGSTKYPDEQVFFQKVADSQGQSNAFTEDSLTTYLFSANHANFQEILDLFSQFFIAPLFKEESRKKELQAVDQEYRMQLNNDAHRMYAILQETANQNHPGSRFSIGNAQTLSNLPSEALKNWFSSHYFANNMHLILFSNQPIEKLIQMTQEMFSSIPSGHLLKTTIDPPFTTPLQKGHLIYIEPILNLNQLSLIWEIDPEDRYDVDTLRLVSYALNTKGENSLFQFLKQKDFAEDLTATLVFTGSQISSLVLTICLSDLGLTHLNQVCLHTFQTIAQLRTDSAFSNVFIEYKNMLDIAYQWQTAIPSFSYLKQLSSQIVQEPLSTFPLKSSSLSTYRPKALKNFCLKLTPEKAVFIVLAPEALTQQKLHKKERWFSGKYATVKPDKEAFLAWKEALPFSTLGKIEPNPFVPHHFQLLPKKGNKKPLEDLQTLEESLFGKGYFIKDNLYFHPSISIQIGIKTPLINNETKQIVLTELFILHLKENLQATLSSAQAAGLSSYIFQKDLACNISIDGYHDKAPLLLKKILFACKDNTKLSTNKFSLLKEKLQKSFKNLAEKTLSIYQAKYLLSHVLYSDHPSVEAFLETLQKISYEEFSLFQDRVFSQTYLETLFYGNIESDLATTLWKELKQTFSSQPYPIKAHIKKSVLHLPETTTPYRIKETSSLQGHAIILMIQQPKQDLSHFAAQTILHTALSEAFFDTIRTKQQVAYMVGVSEKEEPYSLLFLAQSASHLPKELLTRFEVFLEDFDQNLEERISEKRFSQIKTTYLETLSKPPSHLQSRAIDLKKELFFWNDKTLLRQEKLQSLIKALSYEDFKKNTHAFLSKDNKKRVAIFIKGGSETNGFFYKKALPSEVKKHQKA